MNVWCCLWLKSDSHVAGGSLSHLLSHKRSLVIAIDSGLEHCLRFSITPQLVLGDLDSVSGGAQVELKKAAENPPPFPGKR